MLRTTHSQKNNGLFTHYCAHTVWLVDAIVACRTACRCCACAAASTDPQTLRDCVSQQGHQKRTNRTVDIRTAVTLTLCCSQRYLDVRRFGGRDRSAQVPGVSVSSAQASRLRSCLTSIQLACIYSVLVRLLFRELACVCRADTAFAHFSLVRRRRSSVHQHSREGKQAFRRAPRSVRGVTEAGLQQLLFSRTPSPWPSRNGPVNFQL